MVVFIFHSQGLCAIRCSLFLPSDLSLLPRSDPDDDDVVARCSISLSVSHFKKIRNKLSPFLYTLVREADPFCCGLQDTVRVSVSRKS